MEPEKLRYAATHEWIHVEKPESGQTATIGISAFAVEALTDLVYITLPKIGRSVAQGESLGEIESVKAVSDIYAPVSGEIVAVNDKLTDDLEVLVADPFGAGWIAKIKIRDAAGLDELLDYAAYQKLCAEEAH